MRKSHWIATVLVLLLGLSLVVAACGGDDATTTTTAPASSETTAPASSETTAPQSTEPIKIGQLVSLTGTGAAPAAAIVAAVKVEAEYINANGGVNGRPIEIITEDDKSDVSAAVAAATKLIDQAGVSALIGPFPQYVEAAARDVAEKAEIVDVLYMPPTLDSLKITDAKWAFLCTAGPDALNDALVKLAKAEGYTNIVSIADNLSIHQETLELLKDSLPAAGINLTALSDTWTLEETDLGPISAKIAAAAKSANPDALFIPSNPLHAPGIQKNLRGLGVETQIVGSPAATSPAMFMQGPQDAEGMIAIGTGTVNAFALPEDFPGQAKMVEFATRFQEKTGQPADFYAGFGYDALHLLVDAMITAGGDDKAAVRDALENTTNWQGMQGVFNYSPTDHVGIHGGLAQWKIANGTFEFIRDLNAAGM